ncbi:23S rRNA (guanine(745)-N(1))-methyltransferase [Rheinheimera nanhaiensis]|uniref:23S rRNA (Guanine745-N1)-methyltransferase n=1 Tax=Rheinheimera nanhaiensis E407-8 TaxID=562729 RepID=I1DWD6_9GAMM|nr:23S rRNA (guanine(745)-N(1))-methyltransferase [Rheinheimera nanhaiensis]GAB58364.1 23S rRNA (guanine745-N1)-methyltransferase [Rheinheimera nanhaiensis E407-8]
MYLCPLCQQPLSQNAKQYQCSNRHSFDIAREGYVNLLPVQQKNSKDPGDNKEMMQARRQFLHAGWYAPLAQAVATTLSEVAPQRLLDLGCGEGYYTGIIKQQLADTAVWGLDISKSAIKFAAKAQPNIAFNVASAYQLPFAANSFDAIVRIYAPSKAQELKRVLSTGGHLLTVTPGPQHLVQIKQAVYEQVRLHDDAMVSLDGFVHLKRQQLKFELNFSRSEDVLALVQMVPLAWKFTAEQKQQFADSLPAISVDFLLDLYQRR